MKGWHHSEETKKQISERMKKVSKGKYTGENNPMYGKHHSEETRKKMSDARKGKYTGENSPHYGKHPSEETRKKMRNKRKKYTGENDPRYGKHHSAESKKKIHDALKGKYTGEKSYWYGKHHSEETRKKLSDANIDWVFVKEFGMTRSIYPYSIFFDGKHKKMIQELYDNRCVITGMTQEEHIDKYGKKLTIHHWNHDKDSEDPFFMISVALNINCSCLSTGENKYEWISLFNSIAEDKWCEMLENGNLGDFYKKFGYDINNCCYIDGGIDNG